MFSSLLWVSHFAALNRPAASRVYYRLSIHCQHLVMPGPLALHVSLSSTHPSRSRSSLVSASSLNHASDCLSCVAVFEGVNALPGLSKLKIEDSAATATDVCKATALRGLQDLRIPGCFAFTATGFKKLAKLFPLLTHLDLSRTRQENHILTSYLCKAFVISVSSWADSRSKLTLVLPFNCQVRNRDA